MTGVLNRKIVRNAEVPADIDFRARQVRIIELITNRAYEGIRIYFTSA